MPYKDRKKNLDCMKKWYRDHREEELKRAKIYQKKNREKLRLYTKRYREERPWLTSYMSAEQRCNNKNNHNYKRYGGSGILFKLTKKEVAFLWERDRAHLLKWATLDRIDNYGNYQLDNCRFIEMSENSKRPKRKRYAYIVPTK